MSKAFTAAMLAASVVCAGTAYAESFSLHAAITTRGVFTCSGIDAACGGEGTDSLVIGTGSDTVRLSFTGVTTDLTITNRAQQVILGTFTVDGREGFTYPERTNPNLPIVNFLFTLEHTEPFNRERERFWRFGPGGRDELPFMVGRGFSSLALEPGSRYSAIVYDYDVRPFAIPNNGSIDLTGDVGVVPEPTTMLLVGGGLVGLVAGRRRRRQLSEVYKDGQLNEIVLDQPSTRQRARAHHIVDRRDGRLFDGKRGCCWPPQIGAVASQAAIAAPAMLTVARRGRS